MGDVVPDCQSGTLLNNVFPNMFTSPSILPLRFLVSSDFFPMDPIVIDYDGVVNVLNSL